MSVVEKCTLCFPFFGTPFPTSHCNAENGMGLKPVAYDRSLYIHTSCSAAPIQVVNFMCNVDTATSVVIGFHITAHLFIYYRYSV